MQKILRIDPKDNLIVALRDLAQGDIIENDGQRIQLVTDVPAKHKFTREPVPVGGIVTLYGVPVGTAVAPLQSGDSHQQRRFSAAGRTNDGGGRATRQIQANSAQDLDAGGARP